MQVRAIWRTYTKAVREREVARGSAGYFDCRSEALAHLVVPVIFGLYSWNIHLRSSSRLYLWEDSRLVGSRRGKKRRASVGDEPSGATNSPAPVPRGEPRPSAGSSKTSTPRLHTLHRHASPVSASCGPLHSHSSCECALSGRR